MNSRKVPQYTRKRIKTSLLIMSFLYKIKKPHQKVLTLVFLAMITSFFGVLFLQNVGLYALGIEGISQALGNLLYYLTNKYWVFNLVFWILFFIMNIPLFILSYFKISKPFTYWNILFITSYSLSGFVFASIPGIEKIFVFANLDSNIFEDFSSIENKFYFLSEQNIKVVLWNNPIDNFKQVSIFLYGISSGLIQSFSIVATLIIGGSTGGFDIYGMYEAKNKSRDLASIFFILNFITLIISNMIGTYIPTSLSISEYLNKTQDSSKIFLLNNPWGFDLFFNPNFVSSIFLILLNAAFVNLTYPKYKVVQIQVYCEKPLELIENINNESHRIYTFSIHQVLGGYTKKKQYMITTNTQYLDAVGLFEVIKSINENLFISVIDIKKGDGYLFIEE